MATRVAEIADGVHQLATFFPEMNFGFNQYLIAADEPLLFHSQAGQQARYTFHGNNGQGIAINITSSTFTSAVLYFYRPNGTQLTGLGFGTGTTNTAVTLDATGTWTVEVDPSSAYTGSASVKLT